MPNPHNQTLVEVTGLEKDYSLWEGETVQVLKNVSCQIVAGDHIALIGPSGSGKSTLLHCLGGLIEPSTGQVRWPALGEKDTLMPEKLQIVFQSPSLYPALNVLDNIMLPMLLAGKVDAKTQQERALSLLERFQLSELADKLPEELSGGQAQRISMIRALAIQPRLILADEPTGQLDSHTAAHFLDQVLHITKEFGTALVIATHDLDMAARMQERWEVDQGHLLISDLKHGVA